MKVVNKFTGEIYELSTKNPQDIVDSWRLLSELIKAAERAKDKLRAAAETLERQDINGYQFVVMNNQLYNYDKTVMRQLLDADTFDSLLVPDKAAVDEYLKENLDTLGKISSELRQTMVPVGSPYQTIRLQKI